MTKPPMHPLVVIDGLGPGGAEMLLTDFAVGARQLGVQVSVAYLLRRDQEPAKDRLRDAGIEPVHLPISALLSRRSLATVRDHIARLGPSVVHTHLGYSDFLAGTAARLLRTPVVSTVHLDTWSSGGSPRDGLKLALFAQARRRLAARVVAVSDAARAAYLARWDHPDHVTVVHNGVAREPRPGAGVRVRSELGLAPDDVVVGMVSVLREGKGHDLAIAALGRLRPRFPDLRLLIVGDGPLAGQVAAQARGCPVVVAGHRDDIMDVLDAMDVLVHPSSRDAFPTALLEAMAARVPIVATKVGGIPEIVVDGSTGMLVNAPPRDIELADALARLVADPEARTRLGAAGRQRFVDRFTARRWAHRSLRLYEEVLVDAGSCRPQHR